MYLSQIALLCEIAVFIIMIMFGAFFGNSPKFKKIFLWTCPITLLICLLSVVFAVNAFVISMFYEKSFENVTLIIILATIPIWAILTKYSFSGITSNLNKFFK